VQKQLPVVPVADGMPECLVFCEWIGMDAEAAAALALRFPEPTSGEAMRDALEVEISKGTAVLEDVTAIPVMNGKRGKQETVCEMPRPLKPAPPPSKDHQPNSVALHFSSSGRALEVEANRPAGSPQWQLALDPADGKTQGSASPSPESKAAATVPPVKSKCELHVLPGTVVLAATLPQPAPQGSDGSRDSGGKNRVTLLFVKVIE
jgi:hypothetical protein